MKIVIDIPEEEYNLILKSDNSVFADCTSKECMMYAIKNGIPLPSGHGRLIDADAFISNHFGNVARLVDEAPTIIDADNKESD